MTSDELDRPLEVAQSALLARFAPETVIRRVRWSGGETQVLELGEGRPLLLVHGGGDGARIPGAGDLPWLDEPNAVVDEIERFLA